MNYIYRFPAIRGNQAGKEYYIAMVPMGLLQKLFSNEDEYVEPEYRAQRKINEARIPEIKKYILENRNSYVFSAISASIDGDFEFKKSQIENQIGVLEIDMNSIFLINDGQHRCAAIQAAILEDYTIANDTISIVIFKDKGLKQSQQIFTDLNKHAVKTSNSLATLYDSRDPIAVATKEMISDIPFFNKYTDREHDNLGKNSSKLFTLNNLYKANCRIIKSSQYKESDYNLLLNYWSNITSNIIEWNDLMQREITKKDLKEKYIITLGVTIQAFGRLGSYFYENKLVNNMELFVLLQKIDWFRSNKDNWYGRTIREDGKVMNNEEAIVLTCNKIKQQIGIELTREEKAKEENLIRRK